MKIYDDQLIVITGAVGFIGSCLVRHLNDCGIKNLWLVDDLGTSEKWRNLLGKDFVDIIGKRQLFDWLSTRDPSSIEAIIHLGACSNTTETDASYILENNYRYSVKLAEYALNHDIRFIYASSAATYGDGALGFSDSPENLLQYRPMNMYGMSKQLFDCWIKNERALNKVTGLKFFNVFGPNEYHKGRMASAIVHMYRSIKLEGCVHLFKSNAPTLFADGEQKRDFVYVKDVVRMIHAFLINDATGLYNIGSGQASTWNALATALFSALQLPACIEYIPMPPDLTGKYQNFTEADMQNTTQVLAKAAACRSLQDAVRDYVTNYLATGAIW